MKKINIKSGSKVMWKFFKTHLILIIWLCCIAILGQAFIVNVWLSTDESTQKQALTLACAAEAGIQKSMVEKLNADASDINLSEYKEVKSSLVDLTSLDNGIRFAYIFVKKNNKVYFAADSEPAGSKDYSPPGLLYAEADSQTLLAFNVDKPFITKAATDRWGRWITAFVPMKDYKTGKVFAVLGVDYPADTWYYPAIIRTIQAIFFVICLLLIAIAFYIAVYSKNSLKTEKARIQYLNDHDYVTGLYNRKYFERQMTSKDKKEFLPLSVLKIDINGLRLINDTIGYLEGDRIIAGTAKIIKKCCRCSDIISRIGGDEFGIIMPNTSSCAVSKIVRDINKECDYYNKINNMKLQGISLSFGYATKELPEKSISDTLKDANELLRNSKLLNRKSLHSEIITSILATVFEKSQGTKEHALRIAKMTKKIGKKLNLPQKSLGELQLLSMLHDIGKVGIDDRVLNKPGMLNDEEWEIMKKHPEIGYRIAKSSSEIESISEYILTHHESWDGTGYPQGLKGEDIPLLSRILAVADAFDAMTQDRVYSKAISKEEAFEEIERNAGTQFDPYIAQVFVECFKDVNQKAMVN